MRKLLTHLAIFFFLSGTLWCFAAPPSRKKAKPSKTTVKSEVVSRPDFTKFNALMPLYIESVKKKLDPSSMVTAITLDYTETPETSRYLYRQHFLSQADSLCRIQDYIGAQAVGDLYETIIRTPDDRDKKITAYYRGVRAALEDNDSVALKEQIAIISALPSFNDRTDHYLPELNDYLTQIREYIPLHNTLEGIWVSSDLVSKELNSYNPHTPIFMMRVDQEGDPHKDGASYRINHMSGIVTDFTNELNIINPAKEVVTFDKDSIYCLWSSESLKEPSAEMGYLLSNVGLSLGSAFSQYANFSVGGGIGGSLAGGLVGGIVEIGVGALMDALMTPTKKVAILQVKMKKLNDRQVEAEMVFSGLKVKGNNQPKVINRACKTILNKVEPEDSIFFHFGSPFTPGDPHLAYDKKEKKKYQRIYKGSMMPSDDDRNFNHTQIIKHQYLTHCRLKADGIHYELNTDSTNLRPAIGLLPNPKAKPVEKGFVIDKPTPGFPAKLAGLKKNDCITHIGGFEVNSIEDAIDIIQMQEPYVPLDITYVRGNKTYTTKVTPVMMYFYKTKENG